MASLFVFTVFNVLAIQNRHDMITDLKHFLSRHKWCCLSSCASLCMWFIFIHIMYETLCYED